MKNIIFLLITLSLFGSCQDTKKEYYGTGELKSLIKFVNDSTIEIVNYYKNGNTKSQGNIINDIKTGLWKEWYPDTTLKWEGYYFEGEREIVVSRQNPVIKLDVSHNSLRVGETYAFKIYVKGLHPEDILIACTNGKVELETRSDLYDFKFTPDSRGEMELFIYANIMQDEYYIGRVLFKVQ